MYTDPKMTHDFVLWVWVFCLHVCICTMCVPDAHGSQKRVLGSLELEFHKDVIYHAGVLGT